MRFNVALAAGLALAAVSVPLAAWAQGTPQDYARAETLADRWRGLVTNVADNVGWSRDSARLWHRLSVEGGYRFVLVDPAAATPAPPFDHDRLASALNETIKPNRAYTAITLPFSSFSFADENRAIEFTAGAGRYRCAIVEYACTRTSDAPAQQPRSNGMGPRVGIGEAAPRTAPPVTTLR